MKRLASDDPKVRLDAANRLRRLAERIIPELKSWIVETEGHLSRAKSVLAELDPKEAVRADDEGVRSLFSAKLDEGWRLLQEGDYEKARQIAAALQTLDDDALRLPYYHHQL